MQRVSITAAALVLIAGSTDALGGPPRQRRGPVDTFQIGESFRGEPINVWRVAHPDPDELGRGPDERPALLIVAGLDGRHDFGTRLALTLIDRLVADHMDLLRRCTVYIVPDLNPDNDALFDMAGIPRADFGRAPHSADADRDGRWDEDPAEDLNGDGVITMMRVKNPAPGSGLRPSLVLDTDEPRALRAPDAAKGEIAEYALLIEGVDNDNDGRYNEDGFAGSAGAGVDLDRNFPSLWPEHADGAGRYQLSEPETLRLVEWMLARDNIVCVLAYTPGDNIINTPATGQYAPDGREPTGIEEDDKAVYEKVQEVFKEITKQAEAPKGSWEGSFTQYAYAQFGVWSFATPAWVRPDQLKQEEPAAEGDEAGGGEENGGRRPRGGGGRDPQAERAALVERGVPGFVIDFIQATPDQRAATMEGFGDLSEAERASRMQAVAALPEDVQLRMRALISGAPDPGPGGSAAPAGAQGGNGNAQPEQPSGGGQPAGGGPPPGGRGGRFGGRGGGRFGGPGGPPGGAAPTSTGKAPEGDEARWIKYSDEHLAGAGFVEWTPFNHPQLGEVEIGGLAPGIRHEPPESDWARIADEQSQFVGRLLAIMPDFAVETRSVERVAEGIWRVRVRGTNPGELPARAAIGVKARRLPPIVVSLGVDVDDILVGQRIERWDTIAGKGGYEEVEWTVKAPDGSTVPVEIRSSVFGDRTLNIELKEGE